MTIALSTQTRPICAKVNENKLNINAGDDINRDKINGKIVNLLSNIKKMSFGADFFIFEAS